MNNVEIWVNKQRDGYNFVILPSIQALVKKLVPDARPANSIYVEYEMRSDFEKDILELESSIYPVLLGIHDRNALRSLGKIDFIDPQTRTVLNSIQL